jgi:hypothetical protein
MVADNLLADTRSPLHKFILLPLNNSPFSSILDSNQEELNRRIGLGAIDLYFTPFLHTLGLARHMTPYTTENNIPN